MSLYLITEAFRKLGSPTVKNDDFYDRLSRKYSMILLGISFIVISSSQFVGQPINCFTYNIPGSHIAYVNSVCWITSSYYQPMEISLPTPTDIKPPKILYYQWVPFILLIMMFLFYIPGFVWRNLNKSCGINTKIITKMATDLDQLDGEKREKAVRVLAKHIDTALAYHRDYDHGFKYNIRLRLGIFPCYILSKSSGCYLLSTYLFVKLLYIANPIGQFFLLNYFMRDKFWNLGTEMFRLWYQKSQFYDENRFPRITICDFQLRVFGDNLQSYAVQCLLPINIYNEKIFLLIWFWLLAVFVFSIYGLAKWLYYCIPCARINFIRRFLKANQIPYYTRSSSSSSSSMNKDQVPIKSLDDFVRFYCQQDGMLLLRMIKKNTNNVIAGEIICALWDNWKIVPQVRLQLSPESDNCGQIMGLGVRGSMRQNGSGECNEKLLPPMSGILS